MLTTWTPTVLVTLTKHMTTCEVCWLQWIQERRLNPYFQGFEGSGPYCDTSELSCNSHLLMFEDVQMYQKHERGFSVCVHQDIPSSNRSSILNPLTKWNQMIFQEILYTDNFRTLMDVDYPSWAVWQKMSHRTYVMRLTLFMSKTG